MVEEDIQRYEKEIIQLRKQLADLEIRRVQYQSNVPEDIWQVLADVSYRLDQAEQKVKGFYQQIIADLNHARAQIIESLDEFIHLQEQIRNIEDQFMLNIVRPGYHLKKAIQQREYLDAEYHRMYKKIQRAGYTDQVDLEKDIRRAISTAKAEEDQSYEEYQEELQEDDPGLAYPWMDVDDVMDVLSKEDLIREFKRVVLPAIHPDTSTTPAEVFNTVYEIYKKEDTLLMEAYIIQYRGEIPAKADTDPLEILDLVNESLKQYQRVATRLKRRMDGIKAEIATLELEHPEKLQDNMQIQRQEILKRIQDESEQILYWREKIEGLVKEFRSQNAGTEEEL
jgi:hypothetical protein